MTHCTAPFDLNLFNVTVSSAMVCQAGTTIRTGTGFVVAPTGSLTFRAGEGIVLEGGFQVQTGGTFTAEIDPNLEP